MTKDYFQYRQKSPGPSAPNSSGAQFPRLTAWGTVFGDMNIPENKQKRLRRQPRKPIFRLFLLICGMILFGGCNGFEFKSGMFDFKVNDHHHDAHPRNDSNSTGTLE